MHNSRLPKLNSTTRVEEKTLPVVFKRLGQGLWYFMAAWGERCCRYRIYRRRLNEPRTGMAKGQLVVISSCAPQLLF